MNREREQDTVNSHYVKKKCEITGGAISHILQEFGGEKRERGAKEKVGTGYACTIKYLAVSLLDGQKDICEGGNQDFHEL